MRRSRPDLIVPIRDRRQHRRILTLKNFRNACLVLIAIFAGMTIEGHLRRPASDPGFGRLYGARLQPAPTIRKQPEIVPEVIPDETAADPTLVAAAGRSQVLLDDRSAAPPRPDTVAPPPDGSSHLTIVGGPEGVTIAGQPRVRPLLRGGFGRP